MTGPVGVVGIDAYAGWGIYEACRELGLRIPQDVSVVGFDDIDVTRALQPRMTIVSQRTDEISQKAVDLLERALTNRSEDESDSPPYMHLVVGIDLKTRASVAAPAPRRRLADDIAPAKDEERTHA
jgi:LacI family transcriptional regulator